MSPKPIWTLKNVPEAHSSEFVCSEENESYSGGYPEVIYSVGGIKIGHEDHIGARCVAKGSHTRAPLQGPGFFHAWYIKCQTKLYL